MLLSAQTVTSIYLSLKLATITTCFLLIIAIPIALWLARAKGWFKEVVATIIALPLVLPPTVLGFYLLLALGPHGPGGYIAPLFGQKQFTFSFSGLVIGSIIYSLPFVVQPIRHAFEAVGTRPLEVAATLRASPLKVFWTVLLPLSRPGLITAAVLGFAHTVGEYGVVQMIGGNLAGRTSVISTTVMEYVESDQIGQANLLSLIMVGFSFIIIFVVMMMEKKMRQKRIIAP